MSFWTIIPWLVIDGNPAPYPVFNERAIRATAGIMMLLWFFTFVVVQSTHRHFPLYLVVSFFWLEFFIKTIWWPSYSPFAVLGTWLVRSQRPEWVGAAQKRFAWGLGLLMASAMIVVSFMFHIRWVIPLSICLTCLFLMWMESALGICVGCKMYGLFLRLWWLRRPVYRPACPGWSCSLS